MAILQEANAVFYHPLDNSTESLQLVAWPGSGTFGAGKVSDALLPVPGDSISGFGAESEFLAGSTFNICVSIISPTVFVVAYRDFADSNHGTAKVGTISGTSITFGAETEFLSTGQADEISIATIVSPVFIVAYRDVPDSGHGTAKVGTVSGTTITFGAESEFSSGQTLDHVIAVLSASAFVVAYRDNSDLGHGTAKVGTVAGTDITFGAESEFNSAGDALEVAVTALSATAFVVAYADGADLNHGTAKVGTVSGTDITFGAEAEFLSADGGRIPSVAALTPTAFVVAYLDDADLDHGTAKVGVVSGTDISFGAESEFLTGAVGDISVAALTTASFVVAYRDASDSSHGTAKIGTVAGTDITFGAESEFLNAFGATFISVAMLTTASFVVAYRDDADSNHGTAKVGTLLSTALRVNPPLFGSFGAEAPFLISGGAISISAAPLDATRFVVAYVDQSDSNHGKVRVGTVSGTDITYGPVSGFITAAVSLISVTALSATAFAVTYTVAPSTARARVGAVSGTAITFGVEATFLSATGGSQSVSAAALSATAFVVAFSANGAAQSDARVGTVSGTNITFGSPVTFLGTTVSTDALFVAALSTSAFVVAYADSDDSSHGTAKVGSVSGAAIAFGLETEFLSTGAANQISTTALSATKFVVAYQDGSDSQHGKAKVGTVSGALITFGTESEFLAGTVQDTSVATLTPTTFVVAYRDVADSGHGTAKVGTVAGTDITFGAEAEFLSSPAATDNSVVALSATKAVVAYRDTGDLDHGKANAMTVAVYPTVVGGTRLVFSGWTRSPSA